MTADLAAACADLTTWLPIANQLITQPDTGTTSHTHHETGSRPPWNQAAANAVYDALEGIRRLEHDLRTEVTGQPGHPRTYATTGTTIRAVADLGTHAHHDTINDATHTITSWITAIQQLPAIDTAPRWERIRSGPDGVPPSCPYCACYTLRVAVRSGMVICVLPGCQDRDGQQPRGHMEVGRLSSQPQLVWADGTVQAAP